MMPSTPAGTSFEPRTVVVTGSASGIGLATAAAFAASGATVIGLDLHAGPSADSVTWVECDVSEDASVADAFARIEHLHGRLDVLINNAGIGGRNTVETATDADWLEVFGVNVFGVARVSRHAIPLLRKGCAASVVNVVSNVSVAGTPLRAVYSASKGAVAALTRAMAADLAAEGIRVNAIHPGAVHTAVTGRYDADPDAARSRLTARMPLGHLIDVEEIARAIVYLADPGNTSLIGAEFRYDGGITELVNFGTA